MYHQETGTARSGSSSSRPSVGGTGGGRFSRDLSKAASTCVSVMGSVSSTCVAGTAGNLGTVQVLGWRLYALFIGENANIHASYVLDFQKASVGNSQPGVSLNGMLRKTSNFYTKERRGRCWQPSFKLSDPCFHIPDLLSSILLRQG